MIDFHSHVLHSIDDGPHSISESVDLVRFMYEQEISTAICTPHFYPSEMSMDYFIARRDKRMIELANALPDSVPITLIAGAEVYCDEFLMISRHLEALLIEGTSLLLLELPFTNRWSSNIWKIIQKITDNPSIQVIIAHAERYPTLYKHSIKSLRRLIDMDCIIQINCDSLLNQRKSDYIFEWIDKKYVHLLGTDCHNLKTRPPKMKQAKDILDKRYGESIFETFHHNAETLLSGERLSKSNLFF